MLRTPLTRLVVTVVLALTVLLPGTVAANAQPPARLEGGPFVPTTSPLADASLVDALRTAGVIDEWIASSPVTEPVAFVAVASEGSYGEARRQFLADLGQLARRTDDLDQRRVSIAALDDSVATLEGAIRELMRTSVRDRSSSDAVLDATWRGISTAVSKSGESLRWYRVSLDPLVVAESRLIELRDELVGEIQVMSDSVRLASTTNEPTLRALSLHADLGQVRLLVDSARRATDLAAAELDDDRDGLIAQMPLLHQQRMLATSVVGGLPLVTLDAYVAGAAALDAGCPVDWTLLAGIGRVESYHGTIGGSHVQADGRMSSSILGPLLDGGATEREAAAAAAAAAAEAEAEALAAEAAAEESATPEFDAEVWGDDAVERLAAENAPEVETEFDPVLWGDDVIVDDDQDVDTADTGEDGDGDGESPEEDEEQWGNGFAVIVDTDNGALDGNSRWDRAVGPMQFIPGTWAYWAVDGNGDAVTDPQNLYDAAATAGRFLCGLSESRGTSPESFVLGYNASESYVRQVLAAAAGFAAAPLPDIDLGESG